MTQKIKDIKTARDIPRKVLFIIIWAGVVTIAEFLALATYPFLGNQLSGLLFFLLWPAQAFLQWKAVHLLIPGESGKFYLIVIIGTFLLMQILFMTVVIIALGSR